MSCIFGGLHLSQLPYCQEWKTSRFSSFFSCCHQQLTREHKLDLIKKYANTLSMSITLSVLFASARSVPSTSFSIRTSLFESNFILTFLSDAKKVGCLFLLIASKKAFDWFDTILVSNSFKQFLPTLPMLRRLFAITSSTAWPETRL